MIITNTKFTKGQRVIIIGNGNNTKDFIGECGIIIKFHQDGEIGVKLDGRGVWSFPEECVTLAHPQGEEA